MTKKLIPKYQSPFKGIQLETPTDNTYVQMPMIIERIPYKPQIPKSRPAYVSTPKQDVRSEQEKKRDRRIAESAQEHRKMKEGTRKAEAALRLFYPSTYIGPLFREGSYWDNLSTGEGTGNSWGNLGLDMLAFSLPTAGKTVLRTGARPKTLLYNLKAPSEVTEEAVPGEEQIDNFLKMHLGRTLGLGEEVNGENFEFVRALPELAGIIPRGDLKKFIDKYCKMYGIEMPEGASMGVVVPSEGNYEWRAVFDPEWGFGKFNASAGDKPEQLVTDWIHEIMSHGTDDQVMKRTLREIGFPEQELKMGAWDNSNLTLESTVEDLYRETIGQLPGSKDILTWTGEQGVLDPTEFRATMNEVRKNLYDMYTSGKKSPKEEPNFDDILSGFSKSAYSTQLSNMLDAELIPDGVIDMEKLADFGQRLRNILKYVPATAGASAVLIPKQERDDR